MFILIVPVAHALPRKNYLTRFLIDNQVDNDGFKNTNSSDSVSYEATAKALEIISYYNMFVVDDWWWQKKTYVNASLISDNLIDKIEDMVNFNIDIYDLYYLLRALDYCNGTISTKYELKIKTYLDFAMQSSGGFGPTNTSTSATVASTYFIIQLYSLIDERVSNKDLHKNWVLSCRHSDGGYGGNSTLPSTIIDTYYAVLIINELGSIDDISNPGETVDYLNSFYVDDESDENNYGGYLPDEDAKYALLSSTSYCVQAISILDNDSLNAETKQWVLNRQNFRDGGFADNTDGSKQKSSSIVDSYFAFLTLQIYDEDLHSLEEDVWMAAFDWVVFVIIIIFLIIILAIYVAIRRRRRI